MRISNSLKLLAVVLIGASAAFGQATRTWVSGVGDDANPCSRTAPCKTFAGAISKTAPGGEIDALDPGGFGALTITKSITLDGGGGQVASVLVAGTNGIVVAAQPSDIVIIRNLRIDGLRGGGNANAGLQGINFISGLDLNIENVWIFGFNNNCINVGLNQGTQASVHIINTVTKNCGNDGLRVANAVTPAVQVGVDHSSFMLSGSNGIEANTHSRVVVTNSFVEHAGASGVVANDGDGQVAVAYSDISYSSNGLVVGSGGTVSSFSTNYGFNTNCSINNGGGGSTAVSFGGNRYINTGTCGTITPMNPM